MRKEDHKQIALQALAVLMAVQSVKEYDTTGAQEMLSYVWKQVESGIRGDEFTAFPAAIALSHYFHYHGDIKKGIESIRERLNSAGMLDEAAQKFVADAVIKVQTERKEFKK